MKASEYYVYILRHPETNTPFYVGKGKGKRYLYHFQEAKRKFNPKMNRKKYVLIKELLQENKLPIVEIIKANSEEDALEMEELLIKTIGRLNTNTGPLTNSIETIQGKLGNVPEEAWKKCGRNMKGENNPRFGATVSKETREKISQAQKQKVLDGTFVSVKGRKWSEDRIEYIKKLRKERYFKPESFIQSAFEKYKEIVALFLSKPDLVGVVEGYCPKSGKYVTYKRQFCKNFCKKYQMSGNGMHNILSGKSKTYNKLFLEIGIDLCNI